MTARETEEIGSSRSASFGAGGLPASRRGRALGLLALCFGCVALDNTKLIAAMPTLTRVYGESPALHWVVEAGLLVYASLLLLGGSLAERYGARRLLFAGLTLFGLGSLGALWAETAAELVVLRVVVGFGAALITPATLATVKHLYGDRERPLAIAVWTAAYGVFATAGPLVSGWVLARFAPSAVLVVNVPLVLVALVLAVRLVPSDLPRRLVPLDVTSVLLAFAGTASLLFAILQGPSLGPSAPAIRGAVVLTVALYGALALWSRRATHPLLDPALFGDFRIRFPLAVILFGYLAYSGTAFVVTGVFQVARAHSAFEAGLWTMPLSLSLLAGTSLAPMLMARLGAGPALVASAALATAGAALLALGSTHSSDVVLSALQIPLGLGCGAIFVNATESVLGSAPSERAGTAAAVNEGAFEFGGVIGIAILGAFLGSPLLARDVFAANATRALWVGFASVSASAALVLLFRRRAAQGMRTDSASNRG